jgi:hypothetical protein
MVLEVLLPDQFAEVLSWLRTGELQDRLAALEAIANDRDRDNRHQQSASEQANRDADQRTDQQGSSTRPPKPTKATKESADAASESTAIAAPDPAAEGAPSASPSTPSTLPVFSDDLVRWAKLDPGLAGTDLSPYLHLAASFSGDLLVSEELPARLRDAALQLAATGPTNSAGAEKQARGLPIEDAETLIRFFARRARDRINEQRGAVAAIGRLSLAHPSLGSLALDAFKRLPVEHLQVATAMHLRNLSIDGIDAVVGDLASRADGAVKNALTVSMPKKATS